MIATHLAMRCIAAAGALAIAAVVAAAATPAPPRVVKLQIPFGDSNCVSTSFVRPRGSAQAVRTLKLTRRCAGVDALVCSFADGRPAPAWRCDTVELTAARRSWSSPTTALDGTYYVAACKALDSEACYDSLSRLEGAAQNRQDRSFDIVGALSGSSGNDCRGRPIAQCGLTARGERG